MKLHQRPPPFPISQRWRCHVLISGASLELPSAIQFVQKDWLVWHRVELLHSKDEVRIYINSAKPAGAPEGFITCWDTQRGHLNACVLIQAHGATDCCFLVSNESLWLASWSLPKAIPVAEMGRANEVTRTIRMCGNAAQTMRCYLKQCIEKSEFPCKSSHILARYSCNCKIFYWVLLLEHIVAHACCIQYTC